MGSADLPHAWIAALMQTYYKLEIENECITVKPGIYRALSDVKRLTLAHIDELTGVKMPLD